MAVDPDVAEGPEAGAGSVITTTTVTSTSSSFFSGLTGNAASGYRIRFHIKTSTSSTLLCRFNDDTGTTHSHGITGPQFASPTIVAQNAVDRTAFPLSADLTDAGFCQGTVDITNSASGQFRGFVSSSHTYNQGSGINIHTTCAGSWLNTTDELIKIAFVMSGTVTEFRATLETIA